MLAPSLAQAQNTGLERLTRREQVLGWEAVGRIDLGDGGFCTGTLIATDLVLTAAHCLSGRDGAPPDLTKTRFRAGLSNGAAIAEAQVVRAVVHAGYEPARGVTEGNVRHDVALLQIAPAIPAALAAPFTVAAPGERSEVSVVSYAMGREEALSWQRACTVLGRTGGLIAVDCDVTFGSSGAPVFDRSGNRARIVSIISSGGQRNGKTVAFGMALPGLVADLKAQLWSGRGVVTAAPAQGPTVRRIGAGEGRRDIGARFVRP